MAEPGFKMLLHRADTLLPRAGFSLPCAGQPPALISFSVSGPKPPSLPGQCFLSATQTGVPFSPYPSLSIVSCHFSPWSPCSSQNPRHQVPAPLALGTHAFRPVSLTFLIQYSKLTIAVTKVRVINTMAQSGTETFSWGFGPEEQRDSDQVRWDLKSTLGPLPPPHRPPWLSIFPSVILMFIQL